MLFPKINHTQNMKLWFDVDQLEFIFECRNFFDRSTPGNGHSLMFGRSGWQLAVDAKQSQSFPQFCYEGVGIDHHVADLSILLDGSKIGEEWPSIYTLVGRCTAWWSD